MRERGRGKGASRRTGAGRVKRATFSAAYRRRSQVDAEIPTLLRWIHVFTQLENRPCARHPDSRACLLVCRVSLCDLVTGVGVFAGNVTRAVGSTLLGHGWDCRPFVVPLRPAP